MKVFFFICFALFSFCLYSQGGTDEVLNCKDFKCYDIEYIVEGDYNWEYSPPLVQTGAYSCSNSLVVCGVWEELPQDRTNPEWLIRNFWTPEVYGGQREDLEVQKIFKETFLKLDVGNRNRANTSFINSTIAGLDDGSDSSDLAIALAIKTYLDPTIDTWEDDYLNYAKYQFALKMENKNAIWEELFKVTLDHYASFINIGQNGQIGQIPNVIDLFGKINDGAELVSGVDLNASDKLLGDMKYKVDKNLEKIKNKIDGTSETDSGN